MIAGGSDRSYARQLLYVKRKAKLIARVVKSSNCNARLLAEFHNLVCERTFQFVCL